MSLDKVKSGNELFQRCLQGDSQAWDELRRFVYHRIKKITWDSTQDITDRVQTVLAHIHETIRAADFERPDDFFAFVATVTTNRVIDQVRTRDERQQTVTLSMTVLESSHETDDCPGLQFASLNPDPFELTEKKMLFDACRKAIQELTDPKQRAALELYLQYQCGDPTIKNYEDIAKKLKVKKGTAGSLISRAIQELHSILKQKGISLGQFF